MSRHADSLVASVSRHGGLSPSSRFTGTLASAVPVRVSRSSCRSCVLPVSHRRCLAQRGPVRRCRHLVDRTSDRCLQPAAAHTQSGSVLGRYPDRRYRRTGAPLQPTKPRPAIRSRKLRRSTAAPLPARLPTIQPSRSARITAARVPARPVTRQRHRRRSARSRTRPATAAPHTGFRKRRAPISARSTTTAAAD